MLARARLGAEEHPCARQVPGSAAGAILICWQSRCSRRSEEPQRGADRENVAFSTALFLSQVRLKMLCDTVIDSNLGINTSPQAPAQLIICIINTHIK